MAAATTTTFGFYISLQIQKPFIAVFQETVQLIFKRSGRLMTRRTITAGKRTALGHTRRFMQRSSSLEAFFSLETMLASFLKNNRKRRE